MWLTKNEKKVLKLLLDNAKLSDTSIADKLNISSQAVGRIRKILEEEIINDYTIQVNSSKLSPGIFALIKFRFQEESNRIELEKKIINLENTILLIKTMQGDFSYVLVAGFKNFEEMEKFINPQNSSENLRFNLIISEVMPFCQKNILKDSKKDFLNMIIDKSGTKSGKIDFEQTSSQNSG